MERKLTSFDIARMAGVSQTSVSLVLRGKWRGRVGEDTAKKILAVCDKYNYRVNYAASSLKTGKSRNISLVVPDSENPFFSHILHSLRVRSIPKGYECMLVETANSKTWYDYIEGSLLGGETAYAVSLYNDLIEVSPAIAGSVITVNDVPGSGSSIVIDFRWATGEAVKLFREKGYDSIIYLHSIKDSPESVRVKVFNEECEKYGIKHSELLITGHIENNVENLLLNIKSTFSTRQALLLGDDLYAKGTYFFAQRSGLGIGKDLGVISLNNTYICDCFTPRLTSFGFNAENLVSAIMEMIENGETETKTVMLQTHSNGNTSF